MLVDAHAKMDEARRLVVSVAGAVNHRSVIVNVFEAFEPGPYRYLVTVRDAYTLEFLTTGNPGPDMDQALGDVHWQEIASGDGPTSEDQ